MPIVMHSFDLTTLGPFPRWPNQTKSPEQKQPTLPRVTTLSSNVVNRGIAPKTRVVARTPSEASAPLWSPCPPSTQTWPAPCRARRCRPGRAPAWKQIPAQSKSRKPPHNQSRQLLVGQITRGGLVGRAASTCVAGCLSSYREMGKYHLDL